MSLYTRDEAKYLLDYYSEKVIGQPLIAGSSTKVEHLRLAGRTGDLFEVYAIGTIARPDLYPKRRIDLVACDLGLPAPIEVLLDQHTAA